MKRRSFIKSAGVVGAGAVASAASVASINTASAEEKKVYKWKMVTCWPKNFPGVGRNADLLAQKIEELTDGQIKVKVYGAGELVPALEVFDAVSQGTAEIGHGAAYYWKNKHPAFQFFTSVPFGLTATEQNGWLYYGGGFDLWREGYAKFSLVPFSSANTGVQMGGWFNKEINSLDDIKGLKIRYPGLGGEALKRFGAIPVTTPGGEIFTSLKSGVLDAADWISPYNDLAFGIYKAAKFYYYPGWAEPGSTLEGIYNKKAFDSLPKNLQQKLLDAASIVNQDGLLDMDSKNSKALETLVNEHNVQLRKFPDEVLAELKKVSYEVLLDLSKHDDYSKRVYDSFKAYLNSVKKWTDVSEKAYLDARG